MIHLNGHSECSGCTACYAVCPHGAITMQTDALGFAYPSIDPNICIGCNLCDKVCTFRKDYPAQTELNQQEYIAARHKQEDEVAKSRSGAVFAEMARYVLAQNGVVYGAKQDESLKVVHTKITSQENLDVIRGSKYSQSDLQDILGDVKAELASGRLVLFSGTPCQVSGLLGFMRNKEYPNLLTVDIVCHGVIGPKILKDYISFLEEEKGKKIKYFNFRDKERFGWEMHKESFSFDKQGADKFDYNFYLYDSLFFRPSCHICPYTNFRRVGDITLADFWGIKRMQHPFNDNKGVSLLLINNAKGRSLFDKISHKLDCFDVNKDAAVQPSLLYPVPQKAIANAFAEYYGRFGFGRTMKKFNRLGWRKYIRRFKKKILNIDD